MMRVKNEKEAAALIRHYRSLVLAERGETVRAYQPSGEMPALALPSMIAGAIVGAPIAGLVGLIFLPAIGEIETLFHLYRLFEAAAQLSFTLFSLGSLGYQLLQVPLVVVFDLFSHGTFLFMGGIVGACVLKFGNLAKNRNKQAAKWVSVVGSLAAYFALLLFTRYIGSSIFTTPGWGSGTLAAVAVAFGAFYKFELALTTMAFCEKCRKGMTMLPVVKIPPEHLEDLCQAVEERNWKINPYLFGDFTGDSIGELNCYVCPVCSEGYLDLWVKLFITWPSNDVDSGVKSKKEEWLARSAALTRNEAERLRRYFPAQAENQMKLSLFRALLWRAQKRKR